MKSSAPVDDALEADLVRIKSIAKGAALRIGTLNVHGWKERRYEDIAAAIHEREVDVMCLNELLDWKPLSKLAKWLGMHYAGTGCGSGILSRRS